MSETILDGDGANHPRKIFRRDKWKSLNGIWDFTFDDNQEYLSAEEITNRCIKLKFLLLLRLRRVA